MIDKEQDPQLQAPQEANTTKHINFREIEEADNNGTFSDDNSGSDDDNPTKKAWEELRNEQQKQSSDNS